MIAGDPKVVFSSVNSALPHLREGSVRALGIGTARRSAFLPDLATFDEQGIAGVHSDTWFGLAGPAGMPRPLTERIAGLFNGALRDPGLQQRLAALGAEPIGLGPDAFRALMSREVAQFHKLAAAMGLQPE